MTDFVQAAMIVGDAVKLKADRESLLSDITTWAENNPYVVYGDRNDGLSEEQVALLLEDGDKFREWWWDTVESNAYDYADWTSLHDECFDHFRDRLEALYGEEAGEWDDLPFEVQEAFQDGSCIDTSDVLDTCLRHASRTVYIVAIPSDPNSPDDDLDEPGAIRLPHGDLDDDENEAKQRYLAETFGIDGWACESCYTHERLKVLGKLDLAEVYEKGVPTNITIDPHDSVIFHTSWNGSGCLGTPAITKTVTLPARFEVDGASKWGIQSVYGFTGDVWRHTLNANGFEE